MNTPHDELEKQPHSTDWTVPLKTIGVITLSLLLGYAAHGLLQNSLAPGALSFSTPELINFVLSVLLSGAAIVLAISAIILGKVSERAMIQRSDESIRLQNEVFQKTTDALQRIESSTGVTEKRIEDMISGRAGDLSQKIAKVASEKQEEKGQLTAEDIEAMIKKSFLQTMREEGGISPRTQMGEEFKLRLEKEARREKEKLQQESQYQQRHYRALRAFATRDGIKAIKLAHGTPSEDGENLFDGLYVKSDGTKVGVATFCPVGLGSAKNALKSFTTNALVEMQKGTVSDVFVLLFEPDAQRQQAVDEILAVSDKSIGSRFNLVDRPPDNIEAVVQALST